MDKTLQRIQSIDVLRGLIMIIMALDHSRDYFHITAMSQDPTDLETTTPILFFTRWITHFCAPTFVFLSGTSIYLQSIRKTKKELSWFLFTRGIWLIIAEITINNFGWSFDPLFDFIFLQVIWAIGCSMVILSALIFLRYWVLLAIGLIITLSHNVVDTITFSDPALDVAANLFILTEFDVYTVFPGLKLLCAYAVLPWTGIMLLGYGTGRLYSIEFTPERRRKMLLILGSGFILLFVCIRLMNQYGDPKPWETQDNFTYTILSFLNVTKYPPSLLYACMTLGPAMITLALIENIRNRFTAILNIFGRVPFFYYLLHVYIIHLMCVAMFYLQGFNFEDNFILDMAFGFRPRENFGVSLGMTYILWITVVILCYFPSRWYNKYKSTHKKWWLSYI